MGNEMGNNASGLSEDKSTTVEAFQGAVQADDAKGEMMVAAAETADSVLKETESVSSDMRVGRSHNCNPETDEKEEHKTDVEDRAMKEENGVNHAANMGEDKDPNGKEPGFEGDFEETADVNVGRLKDDTKDAQAGDAGVPNHLFPEADNGVRVDAEVESDSAEQQMLEMREERVAESDFLMDPSRPEEKPDVVSEMGSALFQKDVEDEENVEESKMQQKISETTDKENEGERNSEPDATLKHENFDEFTTIPTAEYVECSNGHQRTDNTEGFLNEITSEENGHVGNLDENVSYATSEKIREEKDESLEKHLKPQETENRIHTNELKDAAEYEASHSDDRLVNGSDCMTCLTETKPVEENLPVPPSEAFVTEPCNGSKKGICPVECNSGNGYATQSVNIFQDSQVHDAGTASIPELNPTDLRCNEVETKQQNKIQETWEKSETSFAPVETGGENIPGLDALEKARAFALEAFIKSHQQNNQTKTDKDDNNTNDSGPEWEQQTSNPFLSTQVSSVLSQTRTFQPNQVEVAEIGNSSRNQSTEKYAIWESVGRLSSESNPDNHNIPAELRKSPSFNLDLPIDAKPEEPDQTPSLYQDKAQDYLGVPVQEKIVHLETNDSCKARNLMLASSKEENEALIPDCPKQQDNRSSPKMAPPKQVKSNSVKGKAKRKPRSSFLGTCICCATVINEVP